MAISTSHVAKSESTTGMSYGMNDRRVSKSFERIALLRVCFLSAISDINFS